MREAFGRIAICLLLAGVGGVPGLATEPRQTTGLQVFVTSVTGKGRIQDWHDAGGLAGLAGADEICRVRADAGGLNDPDQFIAWMSDSADDAYCRIHGLVGKKPADCGQPNLPANAGPWLRLDGFRFAASIERVLYPTQEVFAPINVWENGDYDSQWGVWTGTSSDGQKTVDNCDNWRNATTDWDGTKGMENHIEDWTSSFSSQTCDYPYHLYCLSEIRLDIFHHDFEEGTFAGWSAVVGDGTR